VHRSRSSGETVRAWALVAAQFALIAAIVIWQPPAVWKVPSALRAVARIVGWVGFVWLIGGAISLGRSLTALPLPVEHGVLKTGGFYRLSRHPIYTGLLAIAGGSSMGAGSPWTIALALALLTVLTVKARFEEGALSAAYPGYAEYASRTRRFLPLPR
jgi:protein-S-isoprenylcysteine O-methyltransferase Ste14